MKSCCHATNGSMAPENEEHKLIVLGNQGVGKTALVTRLVHNVFENNYISTIGMDYFTKTIMLGKKQ
jgi:GTPase SAR1 family protein